LLAEVWPNTFVEEANLSYTVSLLRKALGDEVAPYRYIETVPRRGYRFTAPVHLSEPAIAAQPHATADGADPSIPRLADRGDDSRRQTRWRSRPSMAWLAAVIVVAVSVSYWFVVARQPGGARSHDTLSRPLTRLTFDAGLQWWPTWSPDGQRIAFTSERSGNLDIWVQQVAGGPPLQLTNDPAPDWTPDWSPDGSRIVFRSERDGGGLFVMSALGGPARRLTTFGYRPLWSPDGSRILFYESLPRWLRFVPRLFVVSDDGGPPRAVLEQLPRPLDTCCLRGYGWHPDGRRISVFWGKQRSLANELDGPGGWHFWTFSLEGGPVVRSEMLPDVVQRLEEGFFDAAWLDSVQWAPSGNAIYLGSCDGPAQTVWRVMVDPVTLRWTQGPERFTTGPGWATVPSLCRDGRRIAFATSDGMARLHTFRLDSHAASAIGDGEWLPGSARGARMPDLSPDGRWLAYVAQGDLTVRSMSTGKETMPFERDEFRRVLPRWSPDGASLLYRRIFRRREGNGTLVRLTVASGREDPITDPGSEVVAAHGDWTADGRWIVATTTTPSSDRWKVVMLPVAAAPHAETQARVLVDDAALRLFPHGFSPDGQWVSLSGGAPGRSEGSTVFVTSTKGGPLLPVADGPSWEWQDWPRWAADGRTLYFVSDRSGFFNVWKRRFDPRTGPVGPLRKITALDTPTRMMWPMIGGGYWLAIAVTRNVLIAPVFENSGSIWMIDNVDR
jgi:Tol biopolymer transport system component